VRQHLVVARFFDVENFSLERQDCLKAAVTALFRGSTGGFALDQELLVATGILRGAVGKFAGEPAVIDTAFAER